MTLLRDFFGVNQQYSRSANVESDLEAWLNGRNGYVLTPLACVSLERMLNGLKAGGQRAWSIIGPYGSGKSSFALALAQLLSADDAALHADLSDTAPDAYSLLTSSRETYGRFVPIFVSCSRGPIIPAIRRGLLAAIGSCGLSASIAAPVMDRLNDPGYLDPVGICNAMQAIAESTVAGGVIVVIDEFGKALEYMADNRADGDVFVMQMLAEMAARSPKPIVVCTVLHQALDRYFSYLSDVQREELAKIQGRYEEIAFHQPAEQMIRLLAQSVSLKDDQAQCQDIVRHFRTLAKKAADLGLAPFGMNADEFIQVISTLAPIHPLAALLMPKVFSSIAQGERSLFAFLSSEEPYGFQEFLKKSWEPGEPVPAYSLWDLFDYTVSAYGSALYESQHGRNWAASDSALARIDDPDSFEARVIKIIGIISTMGPISGKGSSMELIEFALNEASRAREVVQTLEKRSLIVYRSFSDSYVLWGGSDIDIEGRLSEAAGAIGDEYALDVVLNELKPPRPMVAHRHSYEKGVLRLFCTSYCSADKLSDHISSEREEEADGRLVYAVCQDATEAERLLERPDLAPGSDDSLLVITPVVITSRAKSAALQLKRLQWVRANTPALASDIVASRELRLRFAETQDVLAREIEGITTAGIDTKVINRGAVVTIDYEKRISGFLSELCDEVFVSCPELRNELINRRRVSTQASKARRDLIEAMITHPDKPNLGIGGYPPELGMYLTVLAETGLHREGHGKWGFFGIAENSTLKPVWDEWHGAVAQSMGTRLGLNELVELAQSYPYGVSNGIIPILLVAFLLEVSDEVAVYESGVYMPYLGVPEAERLIRDASRFEIRFFGAGKGHEALYEALREAEMASSDSAKLLGAIRPICSVAARLVPFARNTVKLPEDAVRVRDAVLVAREPDQLLFENLPIALGLPQVSEWEPTKVESKAVELASRLKTAIQHLEGAYDSLCDNLYSKIARAFGLSELGHELPMRLEKRLTPIAYIPMPVRAKALLTRLCDSSHPKREWVESVASLVVGKPPHLWTDHDLSRFDLELLLLRNQLSHIAMLASYSDERILARDSSNGWAARLSVTTSTGAESEHLIQLDRDNERKAGDYARELVLFLDKTVGSDEHDMAIAVAARVAEIILKRRETLGREVDDDGRRPN